MAEETKTVRYLSKFLSLKLVRKPMRTKEVEGQIITSEGSSIRFSEGVYETDSAEEQAYIEARPEFASGIIVKVPGNVKDLVSHQAEWMKDLETREADLKRREAELAAKEARVNGSEEGARVPSADGLEEMKRPQLVEIAEELGLPAEAYKVGVKNEAIVAAIRVKRAETSGTGQSTGGEDNGGAAF